MDLSVMSVVDIWSRFLSVWSSITKDLSSVSNYNDFITAFKKDDRLFYVGIMMLIVSVIMYGIIS